MSGRGPAPKPAAARRGHVAPQRGEWKPAASVGWRHGPIPDPPSHLRVASRDAWTTWMSSWVAAHWSPTDLPGLRQLIRLYDQVERGEFQRMTELRLGMDTYGLTPKGQQDRRWAPPAEAPTKARRTKTAASPYEHLRVVSG